MPDREDRLPRSPKEWNNWNEARLEDLASQVRVVASITTQVGTLTYRVDAVDDDMDTLREQLRENQIRLQKEIEEVALECKDFHKEYREDKQKTKDGNRAMAVAIIIGSFTVLAAIISAAAVIIGGG